MLVLFLLVNHRNYNKINFKESIMPKSRYFYTKRYRAKYPERRTIERKKNYATTGGAEKNQNHRFESYLSKNS